MLLLQSAAIAAKMLVDDKIIAWVLGVTCKILKRKT